MQTSSAPDPQPQPPVPSPRAHPLLSPAQAQVLGGFFVVVGLALAVGMATIAFNTAPTMLHPGVAVAGSTFTGTPAQGRLFVALFVWLIVLGLLFAAAGVSVLKTRRRQTPLTIAAAVMGALTIFVGWWIGQSAAPP